MVQINISNKTFYLLTVLLILVAVAGVTIALNSGDYQVHGHTSDEIQGGGGGEGCVLVHDFNIKEIPATTKYALTLPDFCMDDSVCEIFIFHYLSTGLLRAESILYSQRTDGSWITVNTNPHQHGDIVGTNGDSTNNIIYAYGASMVNKIRDDVSGVEVEKTKIVLDDEWGNYAAKVIICDYPQGTVPFTN